MEAVFKEATLFAMQAAASVSMIDVTDLDRAIKYGEDQLTMKDGKVPSLDDALAIEGALRDLRALKVYRQALVDETPTRTRTEGLNLNGI